MTTPISKAILEQTLRTEPNAATLKSINDFLYRSYKGIPCHLDLSTAFRLDNQPNLVKRIIAAYEKQGWKVTYTSDQREGDFLTFS